MNNRNLLCKVERGERHGRKPAEREREREELRAFERKFRRHTRLLWLGSEEMKVLKFPDLFL